MKMWYSIYAQTTHIPHKTKQHDSSVYLTVLDIINYCRSTYREAAEISSSSLQNGK